MKKQKPRHIVIAAPGQGVGKGGVVRQMQYLLQEAERQSNPPVRYSWLSTHSNNAFWPIYFIGTLLRLLWLILSDKPEAIHLNIASKGSFYRKWTLFQLARLFGVEHIAHLHGGGFAEFYERGSLKQKKRIEQLFTTARAVIVLGKIWQDFVQKLGVQNERVHLIPNAVPTPETMSQGGGEVPHIIFVGHLLPRKGVGELIDALAALKELPWRATLAGSGGLERYQEQVQEAGLESRITFPGWLDDAQLHDLYQHADILVLPSHIENQPLCVLEAMAHGLTIISTNVGTVNEIINEKNAIVIESTQKAEPLVQAISSLIKDADKRKKLSISARERHIKNFTLEAYFQRISQL